MFKVKLHDDLYIPILEDKTITILIKDYNKTDLWYDKLNLNLPFTLDGDYNFFIVDPISKEEIVWKKHDDFYGPVVFNVYLYTQTIEQIMAEYTNEDGFVEVSLKDAGLGGGSSVVPLMQVLVTIAFFKYPELNSNLGLTIFAKHVVPLTSAMFIEHIKKSVIAQKYTSLSVPSEDFLDYLHQRLYWTMDDLKKSFECENEMEIFKVMNVLMFSFDRINMTFKRPDKIKFFSRELPEMDMKDVFKILTYYLTNIENGIPLEDYDYNDLQSKLTESFSKTTIRAALLSIDKEMRKKQKTTGLDIGNGLVIK